MIQKNLMLPVLMGFVASAVPLVAAAADTAPQLKPFGVDLNRYMGKWYEIASFPQWFQKGCVASAATYTLRKDGDVDVLNQCRDKTLDGKQRNAKGKAWVVDREATPSSRCDSSGRFPAITGSSISARI